MTIRVGTPNFVSRNAAIRYYTNYFHTKDATEKAVDRKLLEGEIHLGPPEIPQGQKLGTDEDGRYYLEDT